MLSADFYRSSASASLLRGAGSGAVLPPASFTSRTVASFAAGRMAHAPSFAAASVREAGFTAFAAKEAKADWVQDFLKDLAAVRGRPLRTRHRAPRMRVNRRQAAAWVASRSAPPQAASRGQASRP